MAYEKLKQEMFQNVGGINRDKSDYITDDTQVLDLRNYCFERPGAWLSRPGVEFALTLSGGSLVPTSTYQYIKQTGSSYILFDMGMTLKSWNGVAVSGVDNALSATATVSSNIDFVTYNNFVYYANGINFHRFDGATYINWYIPRSAGAMLGGADSGLTFNTNLTLSGITQTIASGTWIASLEFVRGLSTILDPPQYPVQYSNKVNLFGTGSILSANAAQDVNATVVSKGKWVVYGFTIYDTFGISGINAALTKLSDGLTAARYVTPSAVYLTLNAAGNTVWHSEFDHVTTSVWPQNNLTRDSLSIAPKYLQIFNNHLFASGHTASPSTVYFSEPGDPETIYLESNFQVVTQNSEEITGLKVFRDSVLIFKKKAVFELTGASSENFSLRQISEEYGCLNNRGIAVFENRCWFIDEKGIIEYDGSNFKVVSHEINPFLKVIDKRLIQGLHVKKHSQVWFAAEGKIFVFDYLVGGWCIYDGPNLDYQKGVQVLRYGSTLTDVSFWRAGASNFEFSRFGDSLTTDWGQGITLVIQTKYHKRLGDSTQEMFRRLYINSENGSTVGVTINFYPNYGSGASLSRNTSLATFQTRIDFGVSAKSLSIEMIIKSTSQVKINGYTIESRFLRSV